MTLINVFKGIQGHQGELGHCDLNKQQYKMCHIFGSYQQKPCIF